ncbi:MAG: fused MFS/spermidine synthase [Desulfobacterales bacterium]
MNIRLAIAAAVVIAALFGCDDGSKKVLFDKQSAYERVLVVDEGNRRYLRFGRIDGTSQSTISLSDPRALPSEYIRIAALGTMMTIELRRALMLGLGGGTFTSFLQRYFPDLKIDAVEIDPVVVEAATTFFGVKENARFHIHIEDGAKYIRETHILYDLIFLDAYSGEGLPEALSSPAFFDAVREKTAPGGVVILNLFRQDGRERALINVFRTRFPQLLCSRTSDKLNLVVFGKAGAMPSRAQVTEAARRFTAGSNLVFDLGYVAEELSTKCAGRRK